MLLYLITLSLLTVLDFILGEGTTLMKRLPNGCADVKLITYTTPGSLLLTGLPFTEPAINLALEEVQTQYSLNLTNYVITRPDLVNCDDMVANIYMVPEYVYRHVQDECVILLNPGCDDEIPLGRLSTEWNMPILTSGTTYPVFYDPTNFPTMISFGGVDLQQLSQGILDVCRHFLWSSVAVIHDQSPKASAVYPGIVRLLKSYMATFTQFLLFPVDTSVNGTIPYRQVLDGIRPVSRVLLLLVVADEARAFMIATQRMGKIAEEFVFICAEPFPSVRRLGDLQWKLGDEDDTIARTGFRALLHLTSACELPGNNSEQYVLDRIKSEGITQYSTPYMKNEETNDISMSAYYSVKTLGEVLNQALDEQWNMRDGRHFAAAFRNRSFVFNRRKVVVNPSGVRVMDYCLRDLDPTSGTLVPVMRYDALTRLLRPIAGRSIDWGTSDNVQPQNEPKCGFMGDKPICRKPGSWDSSFVASIAVPVALVGCICVGAALWCIHSRAEMEHFWILEEGYLQPYTPRPHVMSVIAENQLRLGSVMPQHNQMPMGSAITPSYYQTNYNIALT